jgi:hypothetical protein
MQDQAKRLANSTLSKHTRIAAMTFSGHVHTGTGLSNDQQTISRGIDGMYDTARGFMPLNSQLKLPPWPGSGGGVVTVCLQNAVATQFVCK